MGDLIRLLILITLFLGIWFLLSRAKRRAEADIQRIKDEYHRRPPIAPNTRVAVYSLASSADTEPYDGEAIADTIVYYTYGPGKEELRKAQQEVFAALQACGPGWQNVGTIAKHLPLGQMTEDHGIGLASLIDAGQIEGRWRE